MPIHVDMSSVKSFEALPPGYYQAVVAKPNFKKSKAGNDTISWEFSIVEPEEFVGRKVYYNTSLQPQSLWTLKNLLVALGYDKDALSGEVDFEPVDLVGMQCTLVIVEDEWQGETTGKVDKVLQAGIAD